MNRGGNILHRQWIFGDDLDKYVLPHPLLGKVTLREMLYFTIHHNEHHLELLKAGLRKADQRIRH